MGVGAMLETTVWRRLIAIMQEKKYLWVPHVRAVNPLKKSAIIFLC
jgi:hypothetical protein